MLKDLSKRERITMQLVLVAVFTFAVMPAANAMHIMEGYLPASYCILWGIISLPFLVMGYLSIKKTINRDPKAITLIAMAGAFVFVISSLKIPSVTGSCSHMTGTGLGAILFGPAAMSILSLIVLIFQAILLAHGGITTLGANVFSMGIAGPFLAYGIYKLLTNMKANRNIAIFFGAFLGDLFTYLVTSFQLAIAYPAEVGGIGVSAGKFLAIFAPTQLPLSIIEGLLTVVMIIGIETYALPELRAIGFGKGEAK